MKKLLKEITAILLLILLVFIIWFVFFYGVSVGNTAWMSTDFFPMGEPFQRFLSHSLQALIS